MNELEIVQLIRAHNEHGMEELIMHYGALIRYIIAPIVNNPHDQEECFYEVTMRTWDKIELYDPARGTWTVWLTAITRNTALNYSRKNQSVNFHDNLSDKMVSPLHTPEEIILIEERKKVLDKAIMQLSFKDHYLFYRKYYYMQSTSQIAAELGTSIRSIEGKLYRMIKRLRKMLGGDFFE